MGASLGLEHQSDEDEDEDEEMEPETQATATVPTKRRASVVSTHTFAEALLECARPG